MTPRFVLILCAGLLLASCRPVDARATPEMNPPDTQPAPSETTEMIAPNTPDPIAQKMANLAIAQLARKLGIAMENIALSEVSPVQWPDAGLGCPMKGVAYAQVITPGFLILLEAHGQAFTFHTDMESRVILCDARPPDEIYLPP